jgi:UDP-glucose:(heptosyl)LPS alpha-1,3-glucosyltransferase
LRLAVATPFLDKQHGTERVLAELLERLAANYGVDVQLYAQRVEGVSSVSAAGTTANSSSAGILWHKVSGIPGPHIFQFIWWYFANRASRRRESRRGPVPDLVYSPGINASDVDAITAHIVFHAFYEQVRQQLRLSRNSPWRWPRVIHRVIYYHLIMALERRIYSDKKIALSAVSQLVAQQLHRFFGRNDVEVIRNAVDNRHFNAQVRLNRRDVVRSRLGIAPRDFVFLLIGNDWKKKGLDTLLDALAQCRDLPVHLLVVGSDAQESYLKRCETLQLESRVTFLAPSADVLQFYAAADAYVGPSLEDAYGLPILESMACGLPVIASTAAGASEIIVDGENGLLLRDPREPGALSQLMRRLYESPGLARSLGQAAELAAAKESWEAHAERTYKHFQQVLSRKSQANAR